MRVWRVCGDGCWRWVAAVVVTYRTVPTHNTEATHFDTLIVLGCPADPDGKASPEERERVLAAVREFRAGRAGHIIVSGGAVHNRWNEAEAMAGIARGAGVPAEDVLIEPTGAEHDREHLLQLPDHAAAWLDERRGGEYAGSSAACGADSGALRSSGGGPRRRAGRWSLRGSGSRRIT